MAKKENMKTRSDAELATMLAEARGRLRTLRFEAAGARPKDSNAPRKERKEIARVLTEQRARMK
ncbi:50S ribosomal protein L29 [Candidatus Kaiserbacteria bacterium]|nr:50S ribosomal protein L29 [Candidatus Kaiserbacteria bacterium]